MPAGDDISPTPMITDGSFKTCLLQHCFDLDETLSLPTDIPRQVADSISLIDRLPTAAAPSDGDPCPICREGFPPDESTGGGKRVPCGHVFHAACISSWLSNSSDSCPLCRRGISA